jgi:hypothetical protein
MGRPFLLPRFCCRVLVILNLFQDDEGVRRHSSPTSKPRRSPG